MSQAGSLLVFTEGDDLIIGITRTAGATTASLINVIGGAGAVKTTWPITRNTDNFGSRLVREQRFGHYLT